MLIHLYRRRLRQKQKTKVKTADELSEMTKARRLLSKRIRELQGCQQVYIPGVANLLDASQEDERLEDQPEILTLGARGGVLTQYITNTLQGNGQRTWPIPTQNIPRTFRIFPANLTEMSLAWEVFRPFTVFPGDFLIRKCVGKFKMFPKNVPTVFLGGSSKVFFTMSPVK
jgi:hypothetical protein